MKRTLLIPLSFFFLIVLLPIIALTVPTSLPSHSDFSALYNTDLALVHRVPIYDLENVRAVALQHTDIPPENFFLARFPYPPWYALSTFYLGFMSAAAAATLWFELNLVMLFGSVWFLTDGWPGRWRLLAFPLALFFYPVLGALAVGQYDFPVLLGTSLLLYSLRRENVPLTVVGIALLTFKPHVGALILLAALAWMVVHRNGFGRRVTRPLIGAGVVLFASGFIADPAWIVSYPKLLLGYQGEGNVSTCSECASLPVWLSRWMLDGSLTSAIWIAGGLLLFFAILFYFMRGVLKSHDLWLSVASLVTLLVSPYLYNYDFLLLLVPFAVLARERPLVQKIIVLVCYLVAAFALIVYGRDGNISLLVVSCVTLFLCLLRAGNPVIDVQAHTAYNTKK